MLTRPVTPKDIARGWVPMADGLHAFVMNSNAKYNPESVVFCEDCGCLTIPIEAIEE